MSDREFVVGGVSFGLDSWELLCDEVERECRCILRIAHPGGYGDGARVEVRVEVWCEVHWDMHLRIVGAEVEAEMEAEAERGGAP